MNSRTMRPIGEVGRSCRRGITSAMKVRDWLANMAMKSFGASDEMQPPALLQEADVILR